MNPESHQMPVAADRLEPRMRTPRLWLHRGGGCCGREADDDWALERWGRRGRGGLHPAASCLSVPPTPTVWDRSLVGELSPLPTTLSRAAASRHPLPSPKPTRLSPFYVSGLSWHFLLPSHSICASTKEMEQPPFLRWGSRGSEGGRLVQGHTATK